MSRHKKQPQDHPELGLPEVHRLWQTVGLFSEHYLKSRIQQNNWWPTDEQTAPIWEFCRNLFNHRYVTCAKNNEAFTRQELLNKILERLGFAWTDNLSIPESDAEPDYILYASPDEKEKVIGKNVTDRYTASIAILEAKKVNHPLSQISKRQQRYPHQQIRQYLDEAQIISWGILTNGNEWRLYCRDAKPSQFFAINFEVAIQSLENFKHFVALFSPEAFVRDNNKRCRLDLIRESALATQTELEADLRQRVFNLVEILANGFAECSENAIPNTPEGLRLLYENCLIFLYRLLFILYAEGRQLLPVEPHRKYYKDFSLAHLVGPLKGFAEFSSPNRTRLYEDICELCRLINGTDKAKNREYSVPRYNGGLFDPINHPELEKWRIYDAKLAEVLRGLMFAKPDRHERELPLETVDYADLRVQQLGSIYEGLLEHHFTRKDDGALQLTTDKAERKATGTYYTPDYIVKYIVENTVGPLLREIEDSKPVKSVKAAERQDNSFADAVLALNIIDPAMGSGHFLVEATTYLAEQIVYHPTTKFQAQFIKGESQEQTEIAYWRRRVVEACIYGVDLNPLAVELAKLSLWLTTIATDQPLNFLDHHLRCGNSLIGARLDQLGIFPIHKAKSTKPKLQEQLLIISTSFRTAVSEVIRHIHRIETEASGDVDKVKDKESRWREQILPKLATYKAVADLWTSTFFGNALDEGTYVAEAQKILAGQSSGPANDRKFFHWELEFPEVFFAEDGTSKQNPGFDAVIANPPYDILKRSADERQATEISYLRQSPNFTEALGRTFNLYRPFILLASHVSRERARAGMIIPMSVLNDLSSTLLRKFVLTHCSIPCIEAFPQKDDQNDRVFREAKLSTCIMLIEQGVKGDKFVLHIHPGRDIRDDSPRIEFDIDEIKKFDPVCWSIPTVTVQDWKVCTGLYSKPWITNFGKFVDCLVGEIDLTLCRPCITQNPKNAIMLKGTQVYRYFTTENLKQGEKEWINVAEYNNSFANSAKTADRNQRRLVMQGVTGTDDRRRLKATIIEPGVFLGNSVNYLRLKQKVDYNLSFFFALLNSQLIEWRFRLTSSNNNVNNYEIDALPVRDIRFTTLLTERKKLIEKASAFYGLDAADRKTNRILTFITQQLAADRTDVIHDLLAFLAEQMMAFNKNKHSAAQKFLTDLKDFHGVDVHSLKPKTKLDEFWKLETTDLFAHLHANAKTLASQDIRLKESDEDKIRDRFQKAKAKIVPIESVLCFTSRLIDQIVYGLYGLTDNEIKIVEGQS